jgi:hypothetical protein
MSSPLSTPSFLWVSVAHLERSAKEMKTAAVIAYFLVLTGAAGVGPAGFDDKIHYALVPLCIAGCVAVLSRRCQKWDAHIFWAVFCAVSLTLMYREYAYQKWSAESYRSQLFERTPPAGGKKVPIQPPQTTTGSSAPDRV